MDPSDGKLSHDDPNSEVGDLDCDDDTKIQIFNHKCYQVPDDEKDLHVIEKKLYLHSFLIFGPWKLLFAPIQLLSIQNSN